MFAGISYKETATNQRFAISDTANLLNGVSKGCWAKLMARLSSS